MYVHMRLGDRASIRIAGCVLVGATILASTREARSETIVDQIEWAQRYDAGDLSKLGLDRTPILSRETREATAAAIGRYKAIAAAGGWPVLATGPDLSLGSEGEAVSILRTRLVATGDLDNRAEAGEVFDDYVKQAVQRFQARHGLITTGIVAKGTRDALNVPVEARIRQLELNLVRLGPYDRDLGRRYVTANIPGASVETVEDGTVATHHVAGVGKIDRPSPVMETRALDINFAPYWTVPASIVRKDLIPRMRSDPDYLTRSHIRVFDGQGREVAPGAIDWQTLEAARYRFRQDPGEYNALGLVCINIANPYGVFMHDTPFKGDFGDDDRFVSSGCIHVQGVRDYVAWLLENDPAWPRERIDAVMRSGERIDVRIADPVPVYWIYVTAWASPTGIVQFRDDIYRRDGLSVSATPAPPADGKSPS